MHYGKISAILFWIACISFIMEALLNPPGKSGISFIMGINIIIFSPAALIYGSIGIIFDKDKSLAILSAFFSAIPTFFIIRQILELHR